MILAIVLGSQRAVWPRRPWMAILLIYLALTGRAKAAAGRVAPGVGPATAHLGQGPESDERVLVRAPTIPDQDEGTAHVTGEMAKKPSPLGAPNVEPGRQRQGQGDAATPGRPDQRPDPGHLLMMARVDGECRRGAAGRPRPAKDGQHQKAGFIETDQVGAEAVEFFLPWPTRPESTRARDDRRAPGPAAGAAAG